MQLQGNKLHEAVRVVLHTINQMLCAYFWQRCLAPKFITDDTVHHARIGMENAATESSLIAIRALDEFCRAGRRYPDDLLPDNFPGLHFSGGFLDDESRRRINKEIAHLTHMALSDPVRSYRYRDFLAAALPHARHFCHYAKTGRVAPDHQLDHFISETLEVLQHVDDHYVNAEPNDPPNDGPTMPSDNSDGSGGAIIGDLDRSAKRKTKCSRP